jgi:Sec-independent protein translocase protein TatA
VDILLVLIVVLVVVIIWRGPKTLPLLGRAFGQGVREARQEIEGIKSGDDAATPTATPTAAPTDDPTKPSA